VVDYTDGELAPGDVFVIATDGVWEVLGERVVREVLDAGGDVQAVADELVLRSVRNQVQYMGRNDATAVVVAVGKSERQG
jgi:protein phosphatase